MINANEAKKISEDRFNRLLHAAEREIYDAAMRGLRETKLVRENPYSFSLANTLKELGYTIEDYNDGVYWYLTIKW